MKMKMKMNMNMMIVMNTKMKMMKMIRRKMDAHKSNGEHNSLFSAQRIQSELEE